MLNVTTLCIRSGFITDSVQLLARSVWESVLIIGRADNQKSYWRFFNKGDEFFELQEFQSGRYHQHILMRNYIKCQL